jgi:hemerythrin-like metal-binding protein
MQSLEWSAESNGVAVPEIDDDHKAIFDLGSSLFQALSEGALLNAVEPGIQEFISYLGSHFVHEERMMRSRRYPMYAWHKGQHDAVRTKITVLAQDVEKGDREAVLSTIDYTTAWLKTHTAVSDRMLGAFLRTHDLAQSQHPKIPATVRRRK